MNEYAAALTRRRFLGGLAAGATAAAVAPSRLAARGAAGRLQLRVLDGDAVTPCRVHLRGPGGQPVRAPGLPFWNDHFVCEGEVALDLPVGDYDLIVERGPEYRRARAELAVQPGATERKEIALERFVDATDSGWWCGETHVHRDPDAVPLLLRAEDLHIAPVLTIWNGRTAWSGDAKPPKDWLEVGQKRFYHLLSAEDERQGGALLYHRLSSPITFGPQRPESPSPMEHLERLTRQDGVVVEIEKPFWWDAPTWAASGQAHLVGLANNHMCRSRMLENEAWGYGRDVERLPAPRGNGFFTQELYYRLLNCGLRLAPTAGSASGVLPNPVGYNRVYVHLEGELSPELWWKRLLAGRSFVTNGPILLASASGRLPGEVFRSTGRSPFETTVRAHATANDPFERFEVIRDGRVVAAVDCDDDRTERELEATLRFERSGWFLVRVICRVAETFRFASTAPFYVEVGGKRSTLHRRDAEFFASWIEKRIERIRRGDRESLEDPEELAAVLAPHERALEFYRSL